MINMTTSENSLTISLVMERDVLRSKLPSAVKTVTLIPKTKRRKEEKKRESDHKLQGLLSSLFV